MNDPKVVRSHERGGWGCDAVWADDFHHALRVLLTGDRERLLRGVRRARASSPRPTAARTSTTAATRRSAAAASAPAPTTSRRSASSSSTRTTTRSATARSATACRPRRARSRALCTLLSPFTPMLFQGEEHGEPAPFQFFADHIDEEIAVGDARGPPARVRRLRRVRRRGGPRPAGRGHLRALQAHARGRAARACATSTRACSRRAARSAPARRTRDFDEHQGWLRVRRGEHLVLANFSQNAVHVPVDARRRARARHPPRDGRARARRPAPARGSAGPMSDARSGPASPSRSARRGTAAARTSRSSPSTPSASSCACSTATTPSSGSS